MHHQGLFGPLRRLKRQLQEVPDIDFAARRATFIDYTIGVTSTDVEAHYGALFGDPQLLHFGDADVAVDAFASFAQDSNYFIELRFSFGAILRAAPDRWVVIHSVSKSQPSRLQGGPYKLLRDFAQAVENNDLEAALELYADEKDLGMFLSGTSMRLTRTMMLEVLRQDYIRTAWSKGLKERVVVVRHALKNALIPVITNVALQIPFLVGGAVIIEQIFCLPGMGRLALTSLSQREYPLVSAITVLTSFMVLACNLVVDLTYGWLDPRVKFK